MNSTSAIIGFIISTLIGVGLGALAGFRFGWPRSHKGVIGILIFLLLMLWSTGDGICVLCWMENGQQVGITARVIGAAFLVTCVALYALRKDRTERVPT